MTVDVSAPFRNLLSRRHDVARSWKSKGRHLVGWSCSYTPEEVIHGANAIPLMVFGNPRSAKLADAYLPTNTCSFARSGFNSALVGDYEYLDGFVTSNSCTNRNKIFDMWKEHVKMSYMHFINTPHSTAEKAEDFFYDEILKFKNSLEKAFGNAITAASLKNAVQIHNDNRLLLKKAYELRRTKPPLISGVEALQIVLSSMVTSKDEHTKLLTDLLTEAPNRDDPPEAGLRLLMSGSIMDNTELLRIVEAAGGNVVADDVCTGSKYFWDLVETTRDPLQAITRRYLHKIPSSFMFGNRERFKHTIEMAKEFDVEAAIIFVLKFCDTHLFDAPQLIEELRAKGLPVLQLEWEHSLSGIAQLKTRIEAFIEMVRGVG